MIPTSRAAARRHIASPLGLLLAIAAASHLQAQTAQRPSSAAAPSAVALPLSSPVSLDGRLDEPVWREAVPVTRLIQLDPDEGAPVSERTEIRFAYDSEALYVGARLYDRGAVSSRLVRRDAVVQDSDWLVVALDSYHDHLTSYRFYLNPAGVRRDEVFVSGGTRIPGQTSSAASAERGGIPDASWDPVWAAAATVTDSGWVAEMRIPFGQLRFSRDSLQTWGLQIERRIARKQEQAVFAFTPKDEPGGVALYGHLEGLRSLEPARPLEILPYVSSRLTSRPRPPESVEAGFGNPFHSDAELRADFGADVKYRLTSNFTLDATLNPDFGQVELDPAVVNLTAFETRYDEKRPFFVEGAEILRFGTSVQGGPEGGPPQLVYSRRIGRAPQLEIPDHAVYADLPETTTILGAAKLTGRTVSGWSVGLLEAVTQEERALFVDAEERRHGSVVEPLSNYLAARARRDLNQGRTLVGVLGTSTNRRLEDEAARAGLREAAYVGGIDFRHESSDRVWSVFGSVSASHVRGSPEAIEATQRSSARYFQRPDAGHLELDSDATSLSGYRAQVDAGKRAGRWLWNVAMTASSPGFEINDMGFQTSTDRLLLDPNITYDQNRPGALFRRWSLRAGPDFVWNYDGDLVRRETFVTFQSQLLNYWTATVRSSLAQSVLSDRLTRGGPLVRLPTAWSGGLTLGSDPRRAYGVTASASLDGDRAGMRDVALDLELGFKPASGWEIQVGPMLNRVHLPAQYVTRVSDPTAEHTLGARYIFAGLDQTTVAIDTRLNATFAPGVTLELYAQPFLSSNDFGPLKELAAPRTFEFQEYGAEIGTLEALPEAVWQVDPDAGGPAAAFRVRERDFRQSSLRGNAVLRWEWRPGSTLYLVWQQDRAARLDAASAGGEGGGAGSFDLRENLRDLVDARPLHILMFKVSYWLNP